MVVDGRVLHEPEVVCIFVVEREVKKMRWHVTIRTFFSLDQPHVFGFNVDQETF